MLKGSISGLKGQAVAPGGTLQRKQQQPVVCTGQRWSEE